MRSDTPVRKAVFPVAGLGTRFLPATKSMPKEMLPVVDKPLIHYAVEEAAAAGIEQFIFITGKGKTSIEDYFDRDLELEKTLIEKGKKEMLSQIKGTLPDPDRFVFIRQHEPLGLGHAIWTAREIIGEEPFAVLLADELFYGEKPCLQQMVQKYKEVGGNMVATLSVPQERVSSYGILDIEKAEGNLLTIKNLIEKPTPEEAPSTYMIPGRYIIQPEVFEHLGKGLRGAGNEIQLTDGLCSMIGNMPFHGFMPEGRFIDCGSKIGFLEANIAFALKNPDMKDLAIDLIAQYEELTQKGVAA